MRSNCGPSYVYLAITNDGKHMKIGYTFDPVKRLSGLSTAARLMFGIGMRFVRVIQGPRRLEQELLKRVGAPEIGPREWFRASQEIRNEFARFAPVPWEEVRLCSHGLYRHGCSDDLTRLTSELNQLDSDPKAFGFAQKRAAKLRQIAACKPG